MALLTGSCTSIIWQFVKHYVDSASDTRVRTDPKPILNALTKASESNSAKSLCNLGSTAGEASPVAEGLSRVELDSMICGLDHSAMNAVLAVNLEVKAFRRAITILDLKGILFDNVMLQPRLRHQ